jgi:hypothetical protein
MEQVCKRFLDIVQAIYSPMLAMGEKSEECRKEWEIRILGIFGRPTKQK